MKQKLNVAEIVKRIQDKSGLTLTQVASQLFEKTVQALSNQIKNNRLDWDKLYDWAISQKIDFNWLMAGRGEKATIGASHKKTDIYNGCEKGAQDDKIPYNHVKLLSMAAEILESDTEYADSLAANIKSFHRSVANKKLINDYGQRIATLEIELNKFKHNRDERRREDRRKIDDSVNTERRSGKDRRKHVL